MRLLKNPDDISSNAIWTTINLRPNNSEIETIDTYNAQWGPSITPISTPVGKVDEGRGKG
jgi:hypothetical protein